MNLFFILCFIFYQLNNSFFSFIRNKLQIKSEIIYEEDWILFKGFSKVILGLNKNSHE